MLLISCPPYLMLNHNDLQIDTHVKFIQADSGPMNGINAFFFSQLVTLNISYPAKVHIVETDKCREASKTFPHKPWGDLG